MKMIESLAADVPVVATAVAAEGLDYRPSVDYAAAEVEDMADAIGDWIDDPSSAAASAASGKAATVRRYGWDRLGERLEASWSATVGGEDRGRPDTPSDDIVAAGSEVGVR